jgi:lactoylglutathione lyase
MAKAIHSMIRVLDLARSTEFYNRALGLDVYEQFEFDDFTLGYLRNKEDDFELELTLNKGRTEPYGHGDGYGHLAVCVNDCRAERARLASMGLQPGEVKEFYRDGTLMARFFFISRPRRIQDRGTGEARPLSVTLRGVALQNANDQIARALHGRDVLRRRRQDDHALQRYHH